MTTSMPLNLDVPVHLRASGVSVLVDLSAPGLPRIVHWGGDLGDLSVETLVDLVSVARPAGVSGAFDTYHPVSVVPDTSRGWQGTPGLVGSRQGRDHSTAFDLVDATMEASGAGGLRSERLTVVARDRFADLELELVIEMLASGLVRMRCGLESRGHGSAGEPAAYGLDQLLVALPVPREADEILDFTGRWIRERTPQRTAFTLGTRLREARGGKPGHDSTFVTAVGPAGFGFRSGEVWMTHLGWSGNSRTIAERRNDGTGLLGACELLFPGEVTLVPGEKYVGSWLYGAYSAEGLDRASARFHEHLRSLPTHPQRPRPITVNTWEAVYFDHDMDRLTALADAAADVGAERFVLDDGWFLGRRADNAGLGDWCVDPAVYPDGLEPLAEYVRAKGLEFGLWVEPEMINPDSDLARAHPDWVAQPVTGGGRLPLEARRQQVLDLTVPEAYAYVEQRLHALVRELRPSYLKWDHNRDLLEAGNVATGRPTARAQTLAFYRLLDGLRGAFPDLEIESCAGGGGRIDLGVLERASRVWASDCNDPHERQAIQRWTQLIVPPEMIGTHIGPPVAHTTHRTASLGFRAVTALWGHLGIEWDVSSPEASEPSVRSEIKAWVDLHRRFRQLLHSGTVVNSDLPEPARAIHGVVAADRSEGLYGVASLDTTYVSPVGLVRLPGLEPDRIYTLEPVEVPGATEVPGRATPAWWARASSGSPMHLTGRVLESLGVQVPAMAPDDAVLVHVRAVAKEAGA